MADIFRISAVIAYVDGSVSNYTSANDGQVIQLSLTDFDTVEIELFSWPDFRAFMESIGVVLAPAIDVSHISDITWFVDIEDETGRRVVSGFEATGGSGSNSNTPYDPATFPNFDSSIDGVTGNTATATALMEAVSVSAVAARGSSYAVGNSITLTGGTFTTAVTLAVSTVSTIAGQNQNSFSAGEGFGSFAGGTGYSVSDVNTMSDGSTVTVDAVAAGVVTQFTITTASTSGLANNATVTQTSSTGEGATGFSLTLTTLNQAVFAVTISESGTYSVIPSNPVAQGSSSGSGSGATFTMDWGVKSVTVTAGGQGYESAPAVSFSGGTGSAATATLTGDAVSSVAVTSAGSGHTETTTVTIANPT